MDETWTRQRGRGRDETARARYEAGSALLLPPRCQRAVIRGSNDREQVHVRSNGWGRTRRQTDGALVTGQAAAAGAGSAGVGSGGRAVGPAVGAAVAADTGPATVQVRLGPAGC